MQRPSFGRDQLTFTLEAGVCIPELCLEEEAAIGLGATSVGCERVRFG
jgi:hypothetical protein